VPVLLLDETEVRQLLTMEMALEAVESAMRGLARDEAQNIARHRCQSDQAMLHLMGGAVKSMGVMGYKAYSTSRQGARFQVGLYDGRTGALLSLMQADYLGQVRTGAASGVATRYMARPDAETVGLFGTGKQARTQVQAVCAVRNIRRVHVFSPNEQHRITFAREMAEVCGCTVEPVAHPELAARDMDIVITATSSREPVLHGAWINEGAHLNVIGSNFLSKAEIDTDTVRRCRTIVVDSKEQARLEAGDLLQALEDGSISWTQVYELGEVVVGKNKGRQHPQDVTLFKSLGIGLEDVAVAAKVYARAQAAGVGRSVEL
jgi:ornithine cyclodeaminase/alanine dehydrogenase-like protein (mu-crystallin family)